MARTKLQLTLTVTYKAPDSEAQPLADRLIDMVERAVGDGLLTGDSASEITRWRAKVRPIRTRARRRK